MHSTPSALSPERNLILRAFRLAKELQIRAERHRCIYNLRYLTELLYPPDDANFNDFWKRFGEPQEWLLQLCLQWKARQRIEVLPGFSVIVEGKEHRIESFEEFDLSQFKTLVIRQSRETLKTAIRRIDAIHDLFYYPMVRGEPCTIAWFAHKLPEAIRNGEAIRSAMCASPKFCEIWREIIVPAHGNPDKWGTQEYFNTPIHPKGMPERTMSFLAVKTRYEGGRYKAGHFDDLVTGEDRDSRAIREEKKRNIKDRENERDRTVGYRIIQGTDWHPEDAYNELQKQSGVITFKLPCIAGEPKKFFEFYDLSKKERKKRVSEYNEIIPPVFKHLDLITLAESCDQQKPRLFSSQMLLKPELGGQQVFDIRHLVWIDQEDLPSGLPCCIFCDPAFKKPENRYEGDFNAMGVVMFDSFGRLIVADGAYRNDWGETEVFMEAARLIRAYRPINFFMEQKFQTDINPHWQGFAFKNGILMPYIMPLQRAGHANKHTRICTLETYVTAGKIVLVKGSPICNAIEEEADGYDRITGAAGHDDALDFMAQALDPAVPKFDQEWETTGWAGQDGGSRVTVEEQEIWMP